MAAGVQVTLRPADTVCFVPHPEHDATQFASLQHLRSRLETHGYYGGVRLLMVSGQPGCAQH
jgi:glucuronokinase